MKYKHYPKERQIHQPKGMSNFQHDFLEHFQSPTKITKLAKKAGLKVSFSKDKKSFTIKKPGDFSATGVKEFGAKLCGWSETNRSQLKFWQNPSKKIYEFRLSYNADMYGASKFL